MPVTRMDVRIEALEKSVPSLSASMVELKGDVEHLNNQVGLELGKMNQRLEASLALGRRELNDGLRLIEKMLKGSKLNSSSSPGEESGRMSTTSVEEQPEVENVNSEKMAVASVEGNYRKLELPLFNGVDPDSWIFRAERYFRMNKLDDVERAVAAGVCMEGAALSWFQWEDGRRPMHNWTELKRRLLERFRDTQYGTLHQRFLAIKQTGTVAEFRERFEVMAAPLKNVSNDVLEGVFINGLDEEVQAEVLMANPVGLSQIMDLVQRVEDRNNRINKGREKERPRFRNVMNPNTVRGEQRTLPWNVTRGVNSPDKVGTNLPNTTFGFKKLTQAEIQAKKEKGLCF